MLHADLGEFDKAFSDLLRIGSESEQPRSEIQEFASNAAAVVAARGGDGVRAATLLADLLADRKVETADAGSLCLFQNRGVLYADSGELESALKLWDEVFIRARAIDAALVNGSILNNVGVVLAERGERDQASQLFQRAMLLSQRGGDFGCLVRTYSNQGMLHSISGDHFAAVPFIEMALALSDAVDVVSQANLLNNAIWVYEHAHVEPALLFRRMYADVLKSLTSALPPRQDDAEFFAVKSVFSGGDGDEWGIFDAPILLRNCVLDNRVSTGRSLSAVLP